MLTSINYGLFCVMQYVEYFIDRGVLGVNKEIQHLVLEYKGEAVRPNTRSTWDSAQSLVVPVMPPSLVGVCRLLQIYYVLKVSHSTITECRSIKLTQRLNG
jgi:hypothetical protein